MNLSRKLACGLSVLLLTAGCSMNGSSPEPGDPTESVTNTPATSSSSASASTQHASPDRQNLPVPNVKPKGFANPPAGSGMQRYLSQKIAWAECADDSSSECATVLVPLDYNLPDGQAITLAMRRKQATASNRIGTLFINPGGPGASGQDYVSQFATTGLERFDILGWDPRGSGESTPAQCFSLADTDKYVGLDASPDTEAEYSALLEGTKKYTQSCLQNSGALLSHISTQDTARDLDLLRQLVGDKELYFHGVSYGTFIGSTYAEMYPDKVGRLVLDAAVDITGDDSVIQAMGFDKALDGFANWCAKQGTCTWGDSADAVKNYLSKWLDKLDSTPVTYGGRVLTQTLATTGIALFFYWDEQGYQPLQASVERAMNGDAQYLLKAADELNGRSDTGYGSLFYSFNAIYCADQGDDGIASVRKDWAEDQKKAPFFAKYMGMSYLCQVWPAKPAAALDFDAAGAKPIMVIGGTGDSATPYQQAERMADKLESGFLLTFDGAGHGAYGSKSSCINQAVVGYLTEGKTTEAGKVCKPN